MFCKTTMSKVSPENIPVLERWVKEKWGPLISRQEGFTGYYFVTKPEGEFILIMFWKDEAAPQSWTNNPDHQALVPEFKKLAIASVQMDLYVVKDTRFP